MSKSQAHRMEAIAKLPEETIEVIAKAETACGEQREVTSALSILKSGEASCLPFILHFNRRLEAYATAFSP